MPYVSQSWLRDHVEVADDATIESIAQALVSVGLEEEEIHPPAVTGPLVAGLVLTQEKETHANGKTVNYCRVDVGEHNDAPGTGKEPSDIPSRGIICGAHNFTVGDTVVVCLPGSVLPGPFPIAARKTYGHVSDGMICSERELGLGQDHDGIIVLSDRLPASELPAPGTDVIGLMGLGEEVLEINVTPDRGYCFSMRGIAREYGLSTGGVFTDPGLSADLPGHSDSAFAAIVADDSALEGRVACDRFVTQVVRGIDPEAQTPQWMKERLEQARMRPISLTVDVTNYVMLDLGQPLHAYSLDATAAPFIVRRAAAGEKFTTLDQVERTLDAQDLVISDSPDGAEGSRIVGLAGVMGGLDSEIQGQTHDVVIEGAHFDPVSVARTSRRHRLVSEASKRFERGVDPLLAAVAVQRVASLLVEYGGGQPDPECFDFNAVPTPATIVMKTSEPGRLTGVDYSIDTQVKLLTSIGATVIVDNNDLVVTPPTWRPDLTGPAHLVEEIARLDGYDKIPSLLPAARVGGGLTQDQWVRRCVADTIAQAGLVEVLSYPFMGNAHDRQLLPEGDTRRQTVRLRNPLADDAPALRTSLLDTLLDTATRNASRGNQSLAIFELDAVTQPQGLTPAGIPGVESRPSVDVLDGINAGVPTQPWHVAGVLGGPQGPSPVLFPVRSWDWADAIATVKRMAGAVGVNVEATRAWLPEGTPVVPGPPTPKATHDPAEVAPWHPGRVARLYARRGKELVVLGMAGELHPRVVDEYGLPARSCAFEIDLELLIGVVSPEPVAAKKVSVYPPAKIDLAVVVPDELPAADVERVIRSGAGRLLEDLQLFDIYAGEQVAEGLRSLAFSQTLRSGDSTLSAEEVTSVRDKIIHELAKRLKAELRSSGQHDR